MPNKKRCPWPTKNPLMVKYHDEEWGVPLHDDQKLFEFLSREYKMMLRAEEFKGGNEKVAKAAEKFRDDFAGAIADFVLMSDGKVLAGGKFKRQKKKKRPYYGGGAPGKPEEEKFLRAICYLPPEEYEALYKLAKGEAPRSAPSLT